MRKVKHIFGVSILVVIIVVIVSAVQFGQTYRINAQPVTGVPYLIMSGSTQVQVFFNAGADHVEVAQVTVRVDPGVQIRECLAGPAFEGIVEAVCRMDTAAGTAVVSVETTQADGPTGTVLLATLNLQTDGTSEQFTVVKYEIAASVPDGNIVIYKSETFSSKPTAKPQPTMRVDFMGVKLGQWKNSDFWHEFVNTLLLVF